MNVPMLDLTQLSDAGNPWPVHDPLTAKDDCNVVKTVEAVHYFNGAQLSARQARLAAHELSGPTGVNLAQAVFESQKMELGVDFFRANPRPIADLRAFCYAGQYTGLFVDYGYLNKVGFITGDKHYTGIHCVGVWGWRRSKNGILVWDHDPLFDGRRPAIPLGRQHVSLAILQSAAEAYAGAGFWKGWSVKIPL